MTILSINPLTEKCAVCEFYTTLNEIEFYRINYADTMHMLTWIICDKIIILGDRRDTAVIILTQFLDHRGIKYKIQKRTNHQWTEAQFKQITGSNMRTFAADRETIKAAWFAS